MEKIVVLPVDDLQRLIIDCVNACLKHHTPKEGTLPKADALPFEDALKFINEQGYPISESKLYKLTSSKEIPFRNFGRKLIFSRRELLTWVKSQTVDRNDTSEAELAVAKSARRKQGRRVHA